jgi:hypothetical protein
MYLSLFSSQALEEATILINEVSKWDPVHWAFQKFTNRIYHPCGVFQTSLHLTPYLATKHHRYTTMQNQTHGKPKMKKDENKATGVELCLTVAFNQTQYSHHTFKASKQREIK